jgi:hypothetical protein
MWSARIAELWNKLTTKWPMVLKKVGPFAEKIV